MRKYWMMWGLLLTATLVQAEDLTLVRQGQSQAVIVLPDPPPAALTNAARVLVDCIKQASGATLSIVKPAEIPANHQGVIIHLGATGLPGALAQLPAGLDDDGFVVQAKGRDLALRGPTDWGTEFAVYDLLERHVGVRWLLPGPDGTDIPTRRTITVPEGNYRDEPVFFSRLFSGLKGAPQGAWARQNRMHGRVSFHHSLGQNIFKPEKYTKTNPEFFPMKDGQTRYLPPDGHYHGWQPCFSAPGSVEVAIQTIREFFRENPQATSFSLGTNDSSGYCRCPGCLARISGERNFIGNYMDYSDLYYDWAYQVIEGVLQEFPDKWFGCLAYSEVAAPPKKAKVHPRLLPYMTYDRMKWVHPDLQKAGHEATEGWSKVTPNLAWYDYIYGTPYCLPRVWFHHSGDYLRYAQKQGVKAHYAEIYPNFGEGPKPYLFLKLWWNPNQDVSKLLSEWYERCVGPAAAPDLAAYYAIWERFWTRDVLQSKWFSLGGQYLNFSHPGYLADVKREDLRESRRLLESCLSKCRTEPQRARLRILMQAYDYYEASALAYQATVNPPRSVATEAEAMQALAEAVEGMTMARKRRHLALEVFPHDPVLQNPLGIDRFGLLAGDTWGGGGLWAVMDWVSRGDNAVARKVEELTRSEHANVADQARMMLALAKGEGELLTTNPSFEEGTGARAKDWAYWVKPEVNNGPAVGRMLRSEEKARSGKASLLCDKMYRGGPMQTLKFPGPGKYFALGWVYVPEGQDSPRGTAELSLTPLDDKGQNMPGYSSKIVPTPGQWKLLVVGADVPEQIKDKAVVSLRLIPIIDSFQQGQVYWDDVGIYRLK